MKKQGISLQQYFVLRELVNEEGLTQRELSRRVGVLEPTIVAKVDALERAGLFLRSRSTTDRRKSNLMLTPRGRALGEAALESAQAVVSEALRGFDEAEISSMRSMLQRLVQNLNE